MNTTFGLIINFTTIHSLNNECSSISCEHNNDWLRDELEHFDLCNGKRSSTFLVGTVDEKFSSIMNTSECLGQAMNTNTYI